MKKIKIMLVILMLVGCSQQMGDIGDTSTTITSDKVEVTTKSPENILHIDGVSDKTLKYFIEEDWSPTEKENVYRCWEAGMDYPEGTIPKDWWGQWIDFNTKEYYIYFDPYQHTAAPSESDTLKKLSYNWEENKGYWDNCTFDYEREELSGDCSLVETEDFEFTKRNFIDHLELWKMYDSIDN